MTVARSLAQWAHDLEPDAEDLELAERALIDSCPALNNAIDEAVLAGDIRLSAQLDVPLE